MLTLESIMKNGGKKYLPETDYVAQITVAKKSSNNGKQSLNLGLKIIDTLPEGGMEDLCGALAENEKVPADERIWERMFLPNEATDSPKGFAFKNEKLTELLVGCGILGVDAEGQLYVIDETIDLSEEPTSEWFLDRYVGIQVKRKHHWSDKEEKNPKEDTITRFLPLGEEG